MSEYGKQKIKIMIKLLIMGAAIFLVIAGQGNIGFEGLLTQVVGLAMLIGLLWDYNRIHR